MINIKRNFDMNWDRLKKILGVLLFIYVCFTVYKAFLSPERLLFRESLEIQKSNLGYFSKDMINITPFSTIVNYFNNYECFGFRYWFINVWGNILFFVPYGFMCPIIFEKLRKTSWFLVFAFILTATIEVLQEVSSLGIFDIDDIILNFIGTLFGYYIYKILIKKQIEEIGI